MIIWMKLEENKKKENDGEKINIIWIINELRVRGFDWRLSQPGFDPSYGKLICLATLMNSDRTK